MTLFYKIKRLIKSDAHALIEKFEEPREVLRQSLRDMEADLERLRGQNDKNRQRLEGLTAKLQAENLRIAAFDKDIDLAVVEKREDIAKTLIRKTLFLKAQLSGFEAEIAAIVKILQQSQNELRDKESRYEEIKSRAARLVSVIPENDDAFRCAEAITLDAESLEHEVELELLKRMKRS